MSVEIPLTKGLVAIVDDEWHWLDVWKWYAQKAGNTYYAKHREEFPGGSRMVSMHRIIMGAKPRQHIDHVNGNGWDNRIDNMRFCTRSQNGQNSRKRGKFSSNYKGVSYDKNTGKWRACICFGKNIQLGSYNTEYEAAIVYDAKAKEFFGEFACFNFPKVV